MTDGRAPELADLEIALATRVQRATVPRPALGPVIQRARTIRRRRRQRTALGGTTLAVLLAWGVLRLPGADRSEDVATTQPPGASAPQPTPTGAPDTVPVVAPLLVLDGSACPSGGTAYTMGDPGPSTPDYPPTLIYESDGGVAGGVASLSFTDPSSTIADLATLDPDPDVGMLEGAGVIQWNGPTGPAALVSTKRMPEAQVATLAQALQEGTLTADGFTVVPMPDGFPEVTGYSCNGPDGFVAVEVLSGSTLEQLRYLLDADPTTIRAEPGYSVLFYGAAPGGELSTRAVDAAEWAALVDGSNPSGGP